MKKLIDIWKDNKLHLRLYVIAALSSLVWVIITAFIDGFATGLGSIILLTLLFVLTAYTLKESRYYIFAGAIVIIFLYDTLLLIDDGITLPITIGIVAIYLIIMIMSTVILGVKIMEFSKESTLRGILSPINFITLGFYTILCMEMTNVSRSGNIVTYEVSDLFPLVLFGLFFIQVFFLFFLRHSYIKNHTQTEEPITQEHVTE